MNKVFADVGLHSEAEIHEYVRLPYINYHNEIETCIYTGFITQIKNSPDTYTNLTVFNLEVNGKDWLSFSQIGANQELQDLYGVQSGIYQNSEVFSPQIWEYVWIEAWKKNAKIVKIFSLSWEEEWSSIISQSSLPYCDTQFFSYQDTSSSGDQIINPEKYYWNLNIITTILWFKSNILSYHNILWWSLILIWLILSIFFIIFIKKKNKTS